MNVRFGILGLGSISTRFASALNTVEGVELSAVAARDQTRSDNFAHQFNVKKAYHNYLDVITDSEVDIVYVGLTNNYHFEMSKLCLENHKAVLCEKPLVTSRRDTEVLTALAEQNQTFLMEALWTRCMPAFKRAKAWVTMGKIGQVKLITANFSIKAEYDPKGRLFNRKLAGGSLFDVGIYPIDLATGILAEYPDRITGLARISPTGVDESAVFSMSFANGALANLTCGFNVQTMNNASIYGTEGHLILDNCYGPQKCELFDDENNLLDRFEESVPDGLVYEIRHCADSYLQGKLESDLIPWQDTIACAGIFDELRKQWGLM